MVGGTRRTRGRVALIGGRRGGRETGRVAQTGEERIATDYPQNVCTPGYWEVVGSGVRRIDRR